MQMSLLVDSQDGSFTLTLFLPFSALKTLDTREAATRFFREHFPSAVDIVGEKRIVDDFQNNPRGNLVMTHVSPNITQYTSSADQSPLEDPGATDI